MKRKKILYLGLDPTRYQSEGEVIHFPMIQIVPRPYEGEVKQAFEELGKATHILFTSRSAIPLFKSYAHKAALHIEPLSKKLYLCIGKATSLSLKEQGLESAYCAQNESAEGIIELLKQLDLKGAHLFFPRSSQGRLLIPQFLQKNSISFISVDLYDNEPNSLPALDLEQFDEIVFTSPSIVAAFFSQAPHLSSVEKCRSIGPITQAALESALRLRAECINNSPYALKEVFSTIDSKISKHKSQSN